MFTSRIWRPGVRHGQAILMSFGMFFVYVMRVNLSVGIVAMTDSETNPDFQTVNWSTQEKTNLLSVFFYGYLVANIIAGFLANKFGPKILLTTASLFTGLTTIVLPYFALNFGYIPTCALRVLHGFFQGFFYPCITSFTSKWAVPEERTLIFSLIFSGGSIGSIVMLASGGVIAASSGGWPAIFYASGGGSIAWSIACFFLASESPSVHPTISDDERRFIESRVVESSRNSQEMPIPWKDIATSVPFIALNIVHLGQNWGFWILLTLLPTFIKGVLKFDISTNGFLSSLPYLAMYITSFIFPHLRTLVDRQKISLTALRKILCSIAEYGGALMILILAFYNSSAVIAVTLLTIAVGLNSATYTGILPVTVDLSPNFADILMGLLIGIGATTSIAGPLVSGFIVTDETSTSQWQVVFLLSAGIFALGNTIFLFFGSAETQPWNEAKKQSDMA